MSPWRPRSSIKSCLPSDSKIKQAILLFWSLQSFWLTTQSWSLGTHRILKRQVGEGSPWEGGTSGALRSHGLFGNYCQSQNAWRIKVKGPSRSHFSFNRNPCHPTWSCLSFIIVGFKWCLFLEINLFPKTRIWITPIISGVLFYFVLVLFYFLKTKELFPKCLLGRHPLRNECKSSGTWSSEGFGPPWWWRPKHMAWPAGNGNPALPRGTWGRGLEQHTHPPSEPQFLLL